MNLLMDWICNWREEIEVKDGSKVFCLSSQKDGVVIYCERKDCRRSRCDGGS